MKRRTFLKMAVGGLAFSGVAVGGAGLFLHQPAFGAMSKETPVFLDSFHYRGGVFHNSLPTPILSDGSSFAGALVRSFFTKKDRPVPPCPVPSVHVELDSLEKSRDMVVWFGHSSFLVQMGGTRFLIDPVFSPYAAPVSFSTRAFPGATPYTAVDIPYIDFVLISHDHWDHLDYPTIMELRRKIGHIVCPLGVGAHFRRWGFVGNSIHEADWGGTLELGKNLRVHVTEARHYSGRSLTRNKTLWSGFMLESGQKKLFYSGDGGYGPHFAALGEAFGGVDFALLDCGQYNERWRYIHMTPEEAAQAAEDLGAKALFPAHVGKFSLARHAWDEPFRRIVAASRNRKFHLLTPRLGEPVDISEMLPPLSRWWEAMSGDEHENVAG